MMTVAGVAGLLERTVLVSCGIEPDGDLLLLGVVEGGGIHEDGVGDAAALSVHFT